MHDAHNNTVRSNRVRETTTTTTRNSGEVSVTRSSAVQAADYVRSQRSKYINNPLSKTGWRSPSPYSRLREEWVAPGITGQTIERRRRPGTNPNEVQEIVTSFDGFAFSYTTYPCVDRALMSVPTMWENDAELRALAALGEANVNVSEMLVEIRKTAEMVSSRSFDALLGFGHLYKRDWRAALRRWGLPYPPKHKVKSLKKAASVTGAKGVAGLILELQYGWLPLMSDVYALANRVDGLVKQSLRYHVKGAVRFPINDNVSDSGSAYGKGVGTAKVFARARGYRGCTVRFDVECDFNAVRSARDVGLTNPFYTAWVAMPSSHVVDWFLPVSDWLNGLSGLLPGTRLIGGSSTSYVRYTLSSFAGSGTPSSTSATYAMSGFYVISGGSFQFQSMRRSIYENLPVPKIVLRNPLGGLKRSANQIAQLVQLLLKGK